MSQASTSSKRPRQSNYSSAELGLLADKVSEHSKTLFGSFSSTITNQAKNKIWDDIATKLSACSSYQRSGSQIRKKWNDYKSLVKRKATDVRRERSKTGGGAAPKLLSDLENKVVSLIPSCQIEGISGGFETDELHETSMIETEIVETTQLIDVSEASISCLPEASITDLQSELISEPSSSTIITNGSDFSEVKVAKKQKRKSPTDKAKFSSSHMSSLLDIEMEKRGMLKDILNIQQEMLLLRREEVALKRERLDLEKEKWQIKKQTYSSNPLSLSPIIKF